MGVGGSDVRTLSLIFGLPSPEDVPACDPAGDCSRGGADANGGGDPAVGVPFSCLMLGPEKLPLPGILRVIFPIAPTALFGFG